MYLLAIAIDECTKYFLNIFYVSGTAPSSETVMNDVEKAPPSRSLNFSVGRWAINSEQINEQTV